MKAEQRVRQTQYPILSFSEYDIERLSQGVYATLQQDSFSIKEKRAYVVCKRLIDIVCSFLAMLVLFLPGCVIALLIYVEDGGNPLFSQIRFTKNGKPFRMYKFRSMCTDAAARFHEVQKLNHSDGLAFKAKNDPRITRIGHFLRSTSLDELPQLWNVFCGDMSLIGPRPPLPREVVLYTPEQMRRLLVKGGLSCIAQCSGRSNLPFLEWMQMDMEYVEHCNLKMDIVLIFKTIAIVLRRKGAM